MTKDLFLQRHTKLTRSLKKFIFDYEKQLEASVFEAFLENLSEELANASKLFLALPRGPQRARLLHQLVDQEIAAENSIQTSCSRGCTACCHLEVEISNYESEILEKILSRGHQIDQKRRLLQSSRALQDPQWKEGFRNATNRCVFLDEAGACSVYESRPVMCRRHSVTSPAVNCQSTDLEIVLRYFPRVDVLISASNEDPDIRIGPLAKMLRDTF